MAERVTFTLTDIPDELGNKIFEQIRTSPKPPYDDMKAEVQEMKRRIMAKEMHESK
ncbi:hypothetical protein [Butyrivibrio proteoclasticus]|uniref:hypothetical protein n=1 Tax=Butyrivibrio proteoclasticus TaxID=43305 RepID=UPI0012DC2D13|nr:hypothetical protein [Butyrivibrio proteoclasticus]